MNRPLGVRLPDAEARQAVSRLVAALSVADVARYQLGASRSGSDEDVCFFVRTTFASLLALPEAQAAPVLRALMFGPGG